MMMLVGPTKNENSMRSFISFLLKWDGAAIDSGSTLSQGIATWERS